jgi:predicted RNA binding protein YcfA (HicA-like mRNA interferase family)
LAILKKNGWVEIRKKGSHRTLQRHDGRTILFSFHEGEEIGPRMMARVAKDADLKPEDL